jgi:SNF2 family DNA or RNA helicase
VEGTTKKVWTQHKSTRKPSGDPPIIGYPVGTTGSVGILRPRLTEVQIGSLGSPAFAPCRFVPQQVEFLSVPLEPVQISTSGWVLPEGQALLTDCRPSSWKPGWNTPTDEQQRQLPALEANLQEHGSGSSRGRTRVHPPSDIVKLEDRLRYLLEPPLESMLAGANLRFPHPPFPYQLDGIAFLYPRHEAVLADEMGLGKTMQAIIAVRMLVHRGQVRRALLVCPKPLMANWQREFALWADELPLTVIEGHRERRRFLWRQMGTGITITNYETLVRDHARLESISGHFDLVILDEAQRIKNCAGATNQAVCSLSRTRSWALTGTPMENSVDDLVGIFEFVTPGHLRVQMKPRNFRRVVENHVLRRTKERVLKDMPPKLYRDTNVHLTAEQNVTYQMAEQEGVLRLHELKQAVTIGHVFELVIRLKQICNFDPASGASNKLQRMIPDLEECAASGRKAIIFSQWVETLHELQRRLQDFHPLAYHGRVPHRQRERVIEQFRDDPNCHILLISYGAGGVGLNLQFANYVFLFDRWWNPAVEDQAINRAHRIGVVGPVTVTRFVTPNTIEERIQQVLEEKRALFDAIFGGDFASSHFDSGSFGLSRSEIFSLFELSDGNGQKEGLSLEVGGRKKSA